MHIDWQALRERRICLLSNQIIFLKFEDERAVGKFRDVNTWVFNNTQYTEMAKNKILDNSRAYIYLVAYAASRTDDWTIVSQEVSAPKSTKDF